MKSKASFTHSGYYILQFGEFLKVNLRTRMGTILGKGFPQAQVLGTVCTSACGKPFPKSVPMAKLHSLLAFES